jgi:hypothetical protein
MIDEPEPAPPKIKPMKRDEKICVGSFIVCVLSWVFAAAFGFLSAVSGRAEYEPLMYLFMWLIFFSLVSICAFICNRLKNWDSDRMKQVMKRERKRDRR